MCRFLYTYTVIGFIMKTCYRMLLCAAFCGPIWDKKSTAVFLSTLCMEEGAVFGHNH